MRDSGYESVFASHINSYIAEMRSVGYKFDIAAYVLFRFDRFCCDQALSGPGLEREIVEAWCAKRPHESVRTQANRIYPVRGLARHIIKAGGSAYVAPFTGLKIERNSYQPHIFAESEIKRLLASCDAFDPCPASPRRHVVMPMAIRLIYGCALRVSEAVHLKIDDVDLDDGTLTIRATKFNKSRIVPMAEGLTSRCRQYACDLLQGKPTDYPFLPSHRGGFYDIGTVYGFFRQALHKAQIPHTGKGPRVHDLRHSAACRCLTNWVRNGKDITNALPYLSAYLGHEDLRGTQHYLRLTAEMYPDIIVETEKSCSWMIPEVTDHEAN
jgi:integrase